MPLASLCLAFSLCSAPLRAAAPAALDDRLAIELFAAEPDLVTPTGIAVDRRGRVLVIESHTHFRPPQYEGPPADRIRSFIDDDGDGRAERVETYFEGTRATMNLAVYSDGSCFVATRSQILRLRDCDDDGRCDCVQTLARLDTKARYPHNGLSGFAFDAAGRVYFGCGENEGLDYRLVGLDGSSVQGGGEGGNIFRCQPNGTQLVRIATGFWNPFHLCFDPFERLFAVDNDPDARPPCRLLHVVPGGDYGYRYRNGRRGLHPFTAWNGELPGTLPMVAGTGEAPSGIVAYEANNLPGDYRGQLLVTSWGDHRIDAFRLIPRGASLRAQRTAIVSGGDDFRPVGIAVAPDGSLFVSDWVDKSYDLHGKGRIWHLRSKQAHPRRPRAGARPSPSTQLAGDLTNVAKRRAAAYLRFGALPASPADWARWLVEEGNPELRALLIREAPLPLVVPGSPRFAEEHPVVQAAALRRLPQGGDTETRWKAATDADPFLAQAARVGLAHGDPSEWITQLEHADPRRRLAALLLLRQCDCEPCRRPIATLLGDPDAAVRLAAIQWVAESRLPEFREALEQQLSGGATTRDSFEALLAALERLDGVARPPGSEQSGEEYVLKLLFDSDTDSAVRCRALRTLRPDHPALDPRKLWRLTSRGDAALRQAIVETLQLSGNPEARPLLRKVAADSLESAATRARAIASLTPQADDQRQLLLRLARDPDDLIRHQAWRSLRAPRLNDADRAELKIVAGSADPETKALAALVLEPTATDSPPSTLDAWMARLDRPGNVNEGERVFFHPQGPGCFRCHEVDGRGARVGPDLSTTGRVLDRRRLVASIVLPSQEIAPQYVNWHLATRDGTIQQGVLLSETADGIQSYADAQGRAFQIAADEIEARFPLRESLMPSDLPARMTLQEFADLVAYLQARQ